MNSVIETSVNLLSEGSDIQGNLNVDRVTRFHGKIQGSISSSAGNLLVIGETGVVDGNLTGDTIIVEGFVRGNINARLKLQITASGRVIGKVECPSILISPGAYFEGECRMEDPSLGPVPPATEDPSLSNALPT